MDEVRRKNSDCGRKPMPVVYKLGSDVLFTFSIRWLIIFTTSLPFYALLVCLTVSLSIHYEQVMNNTWCPQGGPNSLASISLVVGVYYPERYIWELAIVLHAAPRIFLGFSYKHYYMLYESFKKRRYMYGAAARMVPVANIIEISCLVVLSLIGIEENYPIHASAFVTFMFASMTNLICNVCLHHFSGIRRLSARGNRLFWIKYAMLLNIAISTVLVAFAFPVHLYYCYKWAYTIFAVCEYNIVICIIAFHGMAAFDIPDRIFVVSAGSSLTKDYSVLYPL